MKKIIWDNKGKIAITEVLILIIAIFAFGWMISSEMKVVKGLGINPPSEGYSKGISQTYEEFIKKLSPEATKKAPGVLGKAWIGAQNLAKNFAWAYAVYLSADYVAKQLGVDKDKAKIIGGATAATYFAVSYKTGATATSKGTPYIISKVFGKKGVEWIGGKWLGVTMGSWVTAGVFVVMTAIFWKDTKTKTVVFDCKPWDAPSGGKDCDKCNKQGILECSEYQCRALGQGCQLIEGKCIWINKNDVDYPVITLDESALLEGYEYKDKTNTGVRIVNKDSTTGCVKAFTPLVFGVTTNEIAICKMDLNRTNDFDKMKFSIGGRSYNHTVIMALPGSDTTDTAVIESGGNYKFYIRCQDEKPNVNPTPFLFSFCVEQGPDKEEPEIIATSIPETSPYVSYDTEKIDFKIGVNEPSYCKWDTQDKSYDDMINVMSCGENASEMNLQMLFECSTTLTGIQKGDNPFYFKCKDRSENENKNKQPYIFTIKRTQEKLIIDDTYTSPKETVRGSTELVKAELKVKTKLGADEGIAWCEFGETEDYEGRYMLKTGSYEHSQELPLEEGTYKYYVKCVDAGGDVAKTTIIFDVESDQGAPAITRVYKDGNELNIITNENAECVYSNDKKLKCGYLFTDGITMTSYDNVEHSAGWDTSLNYYIKCKDEYGNLPEGDCNMVVRPS